MKLFRFKGGIHPSYNKALTSDKKTVFLEGGQLLYIPLSQHIGAPCEPVVAVGDQVLMGQLIADSKAFVSAPIHSSVSGTVKEIKKCLHPNGTMVQTIVIENDFNYTPFQMEKNKNYRNLSSDKLVEIIRTAGLVGMGGAGFPSHIKLAPSKDKPIECVIVNGAECEPYLSSDHRAMVEQPGDVIRGLRIIMKMLKCKRGVIAIEDNKPDAIEKISDLLKKTKTIEVAVLKTKYPQGSEKHLIKTVMGKEVPSGKLPADVGATVVNADTAISVKNAVEGINPVIRRRVTVSGHGIKNPSVFSVPIGMLVSEVLEAAGGLNEDTFKIIMGGPMTGLPIFETDVPIIKTSSGVLALTEKESPSDTEYACLRCGKCVTACPMNLMPLKISTAGREADDDAAVLYHANDCIECGCCSYACPSHRRLLDGIRFAKARAVSILANKN